MFGFVQWDDPITLLLEVLLSLAIVAGLFLVVRRVNASAAAERAAGKQAGINSHNQDNDKPRA
jgi:hypothetical protein